MDVELTELALQDGRLAHELHVASDGEEAMAFLRRQPPYKVAPRPDIILLDLNLPGISGMQVLKAIREDSALTHIPVIILTVSQDEEDVIRSYELYANGFICKPVDTKQFFATIKSVKEFWFSVVKLPPRQKG